MVNIPHQQSSGGCSAQINIARLRPCFCADVVIPEIPVGPRKKQLLHFERLSRFRGTLLANGQIVAKISWIPGRTNCSILSACSGFAVHSYLTDQ